MATYLQSELDNDSVASSPRSDHHGPTTHDTHSTRVRFMCSFGGNILPRAHDNQLRYVGGDTRIVAFHRTTNFSTFILKLSQLSGISNVSVKYQLPNEDLDALITVTTDEDLENMFEEYDRVGNNHNRAARLRLFLFSKQPDDDTLSHPGSITSLLDGSANREHWFLDALNGTRHCLERNRSEASSIVSEVPDYLFGLDNSDDTQPRDPKIKTRMSNNNNNNADTGSPAPVVVPSPYSSTSSLATPTVPSLPNLPPVRTKPESPAHPVSVTKLGQIDQTGQPIPQPSGYANAGNPMWHYVQDPRYSAQAPVQQIPVYYVASGAQPGNAPVQTIPGQAQYVQQYPVSTGQIPVGYQQMGPSTGQIPMGYQQAYPPTDRLNQQQVYYEVRNPGFVPGYPGGAVVPSGEELQRSASDIKQGRN
ncbi:hypothetical protein ACFE04_019935 [Oxalis oulophora]